MSTLDSTASWDQGGVSIVTGPIQTALPDTATTKTQLTTQSSSGGHHAQQSSESHSTQSPQESQQASAGGQSHVGAIAGGAIAAIILLAAIALTIWVIKRRRKRRSQQSRGKGLILSPTESYVEETVVPGEIRPFVGANSHGHSHSDEKARDQNDATPVVPSGDNTTAGMQLTSSPSQSFSITSEASMHREMTELRAEIERLRQIAQQQPVPYAEDSADRHGVPPPAYKER